MRGRRSRDNRGTRHAGRSRRPSDRIRAAQRIAMRLLHAGYACDRAGPAHARENRSQPRGNPRAHLRKLLSLHRLSRHRRCCGSGRAGAGERRQAMNELAHPPSMSERADELEEQKMLEMERIITRSTIAHLMDGNVKMDTSQEMRAKHPRKFFLMGDDPRLPPMPQKPTLVDYFRHRFASTAHLLQSATHALKSGQPEKVVLACLLHYIAIVSFIRCDHGYWGAQMIEPYVDEEVAWAVKTHQALRFFPDDTVGYG